MRTAFSFGVAILITASIAAAQDVPQLAVGRLAEGEAPVIDGRVEEGDWSAAQPLQRHSRSRNPTKDVRRPSGPKSGFCSMRRICTSPS